MAQETLKGLLQYVLITLPLDDQVWFAQQMEENIRQKQKEIDDSIRKQLIASAEEGVSEIERGESFTNEEVLARMNQLVERRFAEAV